MGLAGSMRAYALGRMAAFGYTGIQTGHWVAILLSVLIMSACEGSALIALKDIERSWDGIHLYFIDDIFWRSLRRHVTGPGKPQSPSA